MSRPMGWVKDKLRFIAVMSSFCWAFGTVFSSAAQAHEVLPAIADLSVEAGQIRLEMRANAEAFLAGIDLDAVSDTDEAAQAETYDALRALPVAEIAAKMPALVAQWNALPLVTVDGAPVVLSLDGFTAETPADAEQPRQSMITLGGDIGGGANAVVAWPEGFGSLVLRQQGVDDPFTGYVESGGNSGGFALGGGDAQTPWQAFASYIPVGFDHIIPQGLDHILFVLGLFLLSTAWKPLLWQISAFTLAHTVTLALGALGLVNIPGSIVEPLIAASIVYVAVENIFWRKLSAWRPAVIFGFGLLHGLGFASVLGDFGLPEAQFVPALIGFNVGVEVGQLAVVAIAMAIFWAALGCARVAAAEGDEIFVQDRDVMFRAVSVTGSLIIALIGAWWVIERTLL